MSAKPSLIVQDFGGKLAGDMRGTRTRLLRGRTWKKTRLIVVIPASESISAIVALSWWNLMFPPNQPVVRILAQGLEVGHAYSLAVDNILAHPELSQWEYMLTLEHDNMPPPDGIARLIERMEDHPEYACVGGLYFTKGPGGVAQIWGDPRDPVPNYRPQPPDARVPDPGNEATRDFGLVECCGTGMGFNLWRMSMFKDKELSRPLFKTLTGKPGEGGIGTQDLAFWTNARKRGYRCAVDCACRVGHYDPQSEIAW